MKERLSWSQRVFLGGKEQIGGVCLSFVSYISGVEYIKVFQKKKISYVKVNM